MEWTSIALALYLPPARSWTNRFGETFTFDDLAKELLDRPSERASCYGTHLFYGLTLLLRVHEECVPILSDAMAKRVRERIENVVAVVIQMQMENGAWYNQWDLELRAGPRTLASTPVDEDPSLLATSHIAEWLMYLPSDLQPPRHVFVNSAMWLLKTVREATPEQKWRGFCPCTHSICVLRRLSTIDAVSANSIEKAGDARVNHQRRRASTPSSPPKREDAKSTQT